MPPAWSPSMARALDVMAIAMGLVVGSFLNVVIARLPRGQSLVRPRSRCPKCRKMIPWYDNIPIVSFLVLRGLCRNCRTRISARYPVVEFLTALLFFTVTLRFGWSWALVLRDWPFCALLIAITFIDLDHRLIPDSLSLGGLALGLATCWMVMEPGWKMSLIGAALGYGVFFALARLYEHFAGRTGLGGGDVKLLAMIGAFVGPAGVFASILISSIFGSVIGIAWGLAQGRRKKLMTLAIPYGPFLVIGALYYYLLGDVLWFRFTIPT